MAKFRNANGDVIETDVPAEVNNLRARAGFTEVTEQPKKHAATAQHQHTTAEDPKHDHSTHKH